MSVPRECRHSKTPFDTLYSAVSARTDIGSDAKIVYARLCSNVRLRRRETQAQLGEATGLTRHRVWSAVQSLAQVGLIVVIRVGLGNPNEYLLPELSGPETVSRTGGKDTPGQSGSTRRHSYKEDRKGQKSGYVSGYEHLSNVHGVRHRP